VRSLMQEMRAGVAGDVEERGGVARHAGRGPSFP